MTWGTKESESKAPPQTYTTTAPATFVPVSSQYSHHPKKSVLAVSSIILISGVFCLLLGIARECVSRPFQGLGMGCGIWFIVTGILGIVSVYKRTKGRLVATAVLALLATLAALWLGSHISNWYWSHEGYDGGRDMMGGMPDSDGQRKDYGGVDGRGDGKLDRHVRTIMTTARPDSPDMKKGEREGDHDDGRKHEKHDDKRESGERRYGGYRGYGDYELGINCFLFFFSLLVFCCSIPLTVFALKTVTSPRNGQPQGMYPRLTPVIAFPPSRDPNQLDSYNGNDLYI